MKPLRCFLHARVAPLTIDRLDALGAPSIELPEEIFWAGDLREFEVVEVVRESSGQFFTLPLAVSENSQFRVTGAASRFFRVNDPLTLFAYTLRAVAGDEPPSATFVVMGANNRPIEIRSRRVRSMTCHPSYLRAAREAVTPPVGGLEDDSFSPPIDRRIAPK